MGRAEKPTGKRKDTRQARKPTRTSATAKTAPRSSSKLVGNALAVLLIAGLFLGILAISAGYERFVRDLPSPDNIGAQQSFKTARILDRKGRLLYEIIDPQGGRRTIVPLAAIAKPLQLATIAVEDATFYVNPGFDPQGIARALWLNLRGEGTPGGSTITQQLIKNKLLTPEVTLQRKIKEAVLAWETSRRYSKERILEMYLNEVYYGNMAYGVEAAARTYFGKAARDLDLAESALLAGLAQSPADYDPFTDFALAKERQGVVLELMVRNGLASAEEAQSAKEKPLALRPRAEAIVVPLRAPHFALYVRDLLEKRFGEELLYRGGLEIHTTLDLDAQTAAEEAVREHLDQIRSRNVTNAALVALDPASGEILAMVGSADFFDDRIAGQVNVATSRRQAGSTLKPFIYLTGLAQGLTPASLLQDAPTVFPGGYRPENHDGQFRGPVRLREALANSLNVPAVQMLQTVGIDSALSTMRRMGIGDLADPGRYGLSLALGAAEVRLLDLTFAYMPFANGGSITGEPIAEAQLKPGYAAVRPATILRVADGSGKPIYSYQPASPRKTVDPKLAYLINSILSDDAARAGTYGRHSFLELSRPAAAKTGTTDQFRDGWTIGYTPDLVAGVWVGNADNTPMRDVYGVTGAGYIWRSFMERVLSAKPPRPFARPDGIVEATICADTGKPPSGDCRQPIAEVFAGLPTWPMVPAATGERPAPRAAISSPADGATLLGNVDVIGTAVAPGKTVSYTLQYASAPSPDRWTAIVAGRPFTVEANLLGRWDTTSLKPGPYLLRLSVSGEAAVTATTRVTITGTTTQPVPTQAMSSSLSARPTASPVVTPLTQSRPQTSTLAGGLNR